MPKFSLPENFPVRPLFLISSILLLILLLGGGYYYYRVGRYPAGRPLSEREVKLSQKTEEVQKAQEGLKSEVKTQEEKLKEEGRPILIEECLQVLPTDPKNGMYRFDKVKGNIFDYFYEGRLIRAEERKYRGCDYVDLVLRIRDKFTISIPLGLLAKTDLGEASPLIFKEHLGQKIQLRLRYEHGLGEPSVLKIVEWQPLVFFVD